MGNKNHLKNINDQNFEHFMRGYDKGFYGNSIENERQESNKFEISFQIYHFIFELIVLKCVRDNKSIKWHKCILYMLFSSIH